LDVVTGRLEVGIGVSEVGGAPIAENVDF